MQPPNNKRSSRYSIFSSRTGIVCFTLGVLSILALTATLTVPKLTRQLEASVDGFFKEDGKTSRPVSASLKQAPTKPAGEAEKSLITVADLAGKPPENVEQILGKPTESIEVNPTRTPCPCRQLTYQDGLVEIIYIKGKADWITVNLPKNKVDINGDFVYTKAFRNPEFVLVKVATN